MCATRLPFAFSKGIFASLVLASVLPFTGCSSIKVKLGMRVDLAKLPVTTMEAALPTGPAIAPGESSPLVVTFTQPDGTILTTEGKGKGKVLWNQITVAPSVVTVNKKGVLSLPRDPRVSDGKTGHVDVTVASHPDLHAALDVPLTYQYAFKSAYTGASGSNGFNGTDGSSGMDGSAGSMDPNNPSAGGDGGAGGNGTDGTNGTDGGDGPAVQVRMTLRPGAQPLLQFGVTAAGHKERFYLVDPEGGTLSVTSEGGNGGSGGKGGAAGRGGSGGIGTPNGNSGMDGLAGHDGMDGSNGRGGPITVTYDSAAKPYLSALKVSGGGRPVFHESAVGPLW